MFIDQYSQEDHRDPAMRHTPSNIYWSARVQVSHSGQCSVLNGLTAAQALSLGHPFVDLATTWATTSELEVIAAHPWASSRFHAGTYVIGQTYDLECCLSARMLIACGLHLDPRVTRVVASPTLVARSLAVQPPIFRGLAVLPALREPLQGRYRPKSMGYPIQRT